MVVSLLRGVGKLVIAGAALYLTKHQGFWGSSVDGSATMTRLTGSLQRQDEYLRQIPSSAEITNAIRQGWNSGVQWTFTSIEAGPAKVTELGNRAVKYVDGSRSN